MISTLRKSQTYTRLRRHEATGQFVRYAMVGSMNVLLFLVIFNILRTLGLPALASNAIGFVVTSVGSFVLNKIWTFRDRRTDAVVRQYLLFLFFTLIGLGLNALAFWFLLIPLDDYGRIGENIAALAALPVSVLWNFTTYRLWTFRASARRREPSSSV